MAERYQEEADEQNWSRICRQKEMTIQQLQATSAVQEAEVARPSDGPGSPGTNLLRRSTAHRNQGLRQEEKRSQKSTDFLLHRRILH